MLRLETIHQEDEPPECDDENDEKDDIRPHAVNSVVRLETTYEEDEPPECDSENDE